MNDSNVYNTKYLIIKLYTPIIFHAVIMRHDLILVKLNNLRAKVYLSAPDFATALLGG